MFSVYCPCYIDEYKCDDAIASYYIEECVSYITATNGIVTNNHKWYKYAAKEGEFWGETVYGMQYKIDLVNSNEFIPWLKLSARRGLHESIAHYAEYLISLTGNEQQAENTLCWINKSFLFGKSWIIKPDLVNIAFNHDQMILIGALLYIRQNELPDASMNKNALIRSIMTITDEVPLHFIIERADDLVNIKSAIQKPSLEYEQLLRACE